MVVRRISLLLFWGDNRGLGTVSLKEMKDAATSPPMTLGHEFLDACSMPLPNGLPL